WLMMSLWDALRMNMMISYQELVRTFLSDIAVGSLTAVLIGAPWVLMTPLSDKLIAFFDRYLPSRISAK
ncbi:hypothetical protein LVR53_13855, partial [Klebsiella pneumoniae]|nr:hypothetical protein [Klebsiella pneumoniae]MCD9711308.1 hypothetical protein [Klebsiella pneumoniae]